MDFPKSVPSVGLVDGKFIDEDAVAGTPGSLIPSAWGNAVTLEMLKVIQEAGLTPDEDDNTQLNAAIDQKISESSVEFASQEDAEAGESLTKAMSPLRVFQAIAKVVTQATESAFGWLKISTQPQVNSGANDTAAVTPKKLAAATQGQVHTAFTAGGTTTALTLSPVPPIDSYAASQRFTVKFPVNSGLNPTLNVSTKGAKALKQYDPSGAKVPAVFFAEQISDVIYDGADMVLLNGPPVDRAQPNKIVITSSTTYSKPAGLKYAVIKVQGGGGGGGGANSTPATQANSAPGGGGGGYAESLVLSASIPATVSVTVGAGGVGGTITGGNGAPGTATSFGSLVTAAGGGGGNGAVGSATGVARGGTGVGFGGTGVGDFIQAGSVGGIGLVANNTSIGGSGGGSHFSPPTNGAAEGAGGPPATAFGGGGPGAAEGGSSSGGTSGRIGGAGKAGVVIIEEYF